MPAYLLKPLLITIGAWISLSGILLWAFLMPFRKHRNKDPHHYDPYEADQ